MFVFTHLQTLTISTCTAFAIIQTQIVVEDEIASSCSIAAQSNGHRDGAVGVGVEDGVDVRVGEVEAITKEKRTNKRQSFELFDAQWTWKQLPCGLKREELINKFFCN